jgi:SAM-dependent methyltransferase
MKIIEQIDTGLLRCVRTGKTLRRDGNKLTTPDGSSQYPLERGEVPILLKDAVTATALQENNPEMAEEYTAPSLYQRLRNYFYKDYSSQELKNLFHQSIGKRPETEVVLSIGGGPIRDTPFITNLNIGPYPNVDIVGDAHELPYNDNTVDAIYISAVLEHLREPIKAVKEIYRVLKPGGQVFSVTPFMQAYHGYPNHFQNYTITGHEYLFASNGFKILAVGAGLGPVVAMTTLTARFFIEYLPPVLNLIVGRSVQALGLLLRPFDTLLEKTPKRHIIASATHVLAEKPKA